MRPLRELTRGAEQKVRILSALAHEPKLLILDEPMAGLELEDKELALSLFQDFAKKTARAVLLFMEKTAEAEAISDDLAFLYKGKLIFAEEKETLKKRYGFLTASDEELEKIPRSAWRGICRTETGGSLLLKSLLPEGMEETLLLEAPSLENIMQYLTGGGETMKALLYKDFLMLRKKGKMFLGFTVIFALFGVVEENVFFFSLLSCLYPSMAVITLLGLEEQAKWAGYGVLLPVSERYRPRKILLFRFGSSGGHPHQPDFQSRRRNQYEWIFWMCFR